jgi:hypothetical protein
MKRILSILVIVCFLFGCGISLNAVQKVALTNLAMNVGYFVGKNNPDKVALMILGCKALALAETVALKEIVGITGYLAPLVESDNIASASLKDAVLIVGTDVELVRIAAGGFYEGLVLAQGGKIT